MHSSSVTGLKVRLVCSAAALAMIATPALAQDDGAQNGAATAKQPEDAAQGDAIVVTLRK